MSGRIEAAGVAVQIERTESTRKTFWPNTRAGTGTTGLTSQQLHCRHANHL